MKIFRICNARFANELTASGMAGRWNSEGHMILYAAEARSLACLENLVHKNRFELQNDYRTMIIFIPDNVQIHKIDAQKLPANWNQSTTNAYEICRAVGDAWIQSKSSAILKVPSAIIKEEFNYLINLRHQDSFLTTIESVEPFLFDKRVSKI